MGILHSTYSLQGIVHNLMQAFNELQDSRPFEIIDAEMVIPFVGTLAHRVASPSLRDFVNVSILTEDIERSRNSDIWKIRISVRQNETNIVRLEKYDTTTIT